MSENNPITARDYQDAINVQDAINLSGVAQSFASVIKRIPSGRNTHTLSKLYVYKMFLLAFPNVALPEGFPEAYLDAMNRVEGRL